MAPPSLTHLSHSHHYQRLQLMKVLLLWHRSPSMAPPSLTHLSHSHHQHRLQLIVLFWLPEAIETKPTANLWE